jgi:excisionase family DNA binding protein
MQPVTHRDVILQLLDDPDLVPNVSPRQALGVVLQLTALQTRLAVVASSGADAVNDGPTCYDIPDVAARLKMDTSHIYKLVKKGDLVAFRQGRSVRVTREDLERFVQQRRHGGSVAPPARRDAPRR